MPFTEKSPMTDPWDYMDYSPSHEVGEKIGFNEQGEMDVGKYSLPTWIVRMQGLP